MVKQISCEAGPSYHDIPKNWINKITSYNERVKNYPTSNHEYFKDWIDKAKNIREVKEMDMY